LVIPAHVPAELVRDFDYHTDTDFLRDPFAGMDAVRDMRVFFSPRYGGYWVLTRHEDIRAVFQDAETFSSADVAIPAGAYPRVLRPLALDPPEHGAYRQVLSAAFAPQAATRREAEVRSVCRSLIDSFASAGRCELLNAFAKPLPTRIFVAMMGLPATEAAQFVGWNEVLLHAYEDPAARRRAAAEIEAYLGDLIRTRRSTPDSDPDDLFGVLLTGRVHDRPLTDDEILDCAFLLFIAGLDTVTAVLGFAFRGLAERPDLQQAIAMGDSAQIAAAVEELLRAHAIVNAARTATRDGVIAGDVAVKPGDRVLLATSFATRDPSEFAHPSVIDFGRDANRHLAFGAGPHRCLGSHLARVELAVALEEFHRRIPAYHLAPDAPTRIHGGGVFGMDSLVLEWPRTS
jgi:cytochrome P450